MQHHGTIWCSHCTGKVFLCGAWRQPSSLWNCISNILFWALTGHSSTIHNSYSFPAASWDFSKWSKKPQWHPAFLFFPEKPLSFPSYSYLFDTETWADLRGAKCWKGKAASRLSGQFLTVRISWTQIPPTAHVWNRTQIFFPCVLYYSPPPPKKKKMQFNVFLIQTPLSIQWRTWLNRIS